MPFPGIGRIRKLGNGNLGASDIHDPSDITGRHYSRVPIADSVKVDHGEIGPWAGESLRFVF
jgi:hypothetical protein